MSEFAARKAVSHGEISLLLNKRDVVRSRRQVTTQSVSHDSLPSNRCMRKARTQRDRRAVLRTKAAAREFPKGTIRRGSLAPSEVPSLTCCLSRREAMQGPLLFVSSEVYR